MNSVNVTVSATIDFEELSESITHEQAVDLILMIDEAQCEVGFTEIMIAKLATALKPCYDTEEEYLTFLESLK